MHVKPVQALLLLVALCFLQPAGAQSKLSVDKVYKITLRNSGPILENEEIKGYYFFYLSDKVDRKTNEYTLQILDANLNKVKEIKFQDSKNISLMESSFNGSSLVFMFYDDDQNTIEYRMYGMDGKSTYTYSKTLDRRSENFMKSAPKFSGDDEAENQNIFDIPQKGFLSIIPVREGRQYTYEVNFYSTDKRRTWTYNPIDAERFTQAQYLGCNDSIAVIELLSRQKLTSREMESTLLGVSLATGKKVFEIPTNEKGFKVYPMNISMMSKPGEFLIMGPYFEGDDRVLQDKSLGLGIWVMNNKGKILSSKYISWKEDVGKFLKMDKKGRVEDMGYVFFHNLIQTDDGKIFAIGEGYKKVASGVGIAAAVLMGGNRQVSTAKMKVTDMILLQLDGGMKLENAVIYDKFNNSVELPAGAEFTSPHTLALLLTAYGSFDYSFTLPEKNKSGFMSGYTDYEKTKDYKGLTFNSISYHDGKITTDKINLKSSASRMRILPAKPGSVLIVEYFKKDKRLDMRMEKLN